MNSITQNTAQNRFEMARQNDKETETEIAVAEYRLSGQIMTVTHVIVPQSQRGQGVASDLSRAVINHARAVQLKIRPQCPFMAAYFERHPEAADLLV